MAGGSRSRTGQGAVSGDGITQGDLIRYYRRIAGSAPAHFRERPLTMQRFPDSFDAVGFFQKLRPTHFAEWIDQVRLEEEDGDHLLVTDTATLVYLADQCCATFHLTLARTEGATALPSHRGRSRAGPGEGPAGYVTVLVFPVIHVR